MPRPIKRPVVEFPALAPVDWGVPVLSAPPAIYHDPILASRWARHPIILERSHFWMEYWQGRGAEDFQVFLNRLHWFRPLVEAEVRAQGLPQSLMYLPILESGYTAGAVSGAGAVGLWQFMAGTARERGLTVTSLVDERRDPVRATPEALRLLGEFRVRFGSWFLALAAYNGGPSRMSNLLRRQTPLAPLSDSLFIELGPRLPRETRDFIPKLIAAVTLASHPIHYGFTVPVGRELAYEEVAVPDAVSVDVIAHAAGVPQSEIEVLNPQLLRGFTPPDVSTTIRVPAGRGQAFQMAFDRIPPSEWVSFLEHKVISGETFSHIARRYRVPVATLQAANPRIQPRRLQIGQWVVVPVAPKAESEVPVSSPLFPR